MQTNDGNSNGNGNSHKVDNQDARTSDDESFCDEQGTLANNDNVKINDDAWFVSCDKKRYSVLFWATILGILLLLSLSALLLLQRQEGTVETSSTDDNKTSNDENDSFRFDNPNAASWQTHGAQVQSKQGQKPRQLFL